MRIISMAEFARKNLNINILPDTRKSQCNIIFHHLLSGKQITQKQAADKYGVGRLAARISDIREALNKHDMYKNWKVLTHTITDGRKRYGSYEMVIVEGEK